MMALLGSGFLLLTSLGLLVAFVLRTPRAVRDQERKAIEAELAAINDALSAFGRGSPVAFLRKPNGALASVTRADFSTLVEHKRRLLSQLRQHTK